MRDNGSVLKCYGVLARKQEMLRIGRCLVENQVVRF